MRVVANLWQRDELVWKAVGTAYTRLRVESNLQYTKIINTLGMIRYCTTVKALWSFVLSTRYIPDCGVSGIQWDHKTSNHVSLPTSQKRLDLLRLELQLPFVAYFLGLDWKPTMFWRRLRRLGRRIPLSVGRVASPPCLFACPCLLQQPLVQRPVLYNIIVTCQLWLLKKII